MSDHPLEAWRADEATADALLAAAGYALPHTSSLPGPYFVAPGDLQLEHLALTTGTLVVGGNLAIGGWLDVQRDGRGLVNIVVLGACTLGVAYLDGFLVVRGALVAHTLIGDTTWDGGLHVGGDVAAECLILVDMGAELDGERHVRVYGDTEDDFSQARREVPELFPATGDDELPNPDPRGYFLARRDR